MDIKTLNNNSLHVWGHLKWRREFSPPQRLPTIPMGNGKL